MGKRVNLKGLTAAGSCRLWQRQIRELEAILACDDLTEEERSSYSGALGNCRANLAAERAAIRHAVTA